MLASSVAAAPAAGGGPGRFKTIALLILIAFALASPTAANRVALVFGNAEYQHAGRLANPRNDANAVGEALGRLGFDVTTVLDAGKAEMTEALRVFARETASASVAAVFYAGHGIEVNGVNYLMPVDAQLERDTDVLFENVSLDTVLDATEGAEVRLVILDACRNNPLARTMQRTGRSRSLSRGSFGALDQELIPPGLLVGYAAAAGTTADDGSGRHSPYTQALLRYLESPVEIVRMFRFVQGSVHELTEGRQIPHLYFSMPGREFFLDAEASAGPGADVAYDGGPLAFVVSRLQDTVERLEEHLVEEDVPESPESDTEVDAERGQPSSRLRELLGREVSEFASDENGWTDLHHAAALNEPETVDLLLEAGAFVDQPLYVDGAPLTDGLLGMLEEAAPGLDFRRNGQRPLHVASAVNGVAAARALLDRGADVNSTDNLGRTALHVAAGTANVEVMAELLQRGADGSRTTKEGERALDFALSNKGSAATLRLLMRDLNVNELHSGWAPLHLAAFRNNVVAVPELLGRGAEVDLPTAAGLTALHVAAQAGSVEVMRELLGRGASLEARTPLGRTPLHEAASRIADGAETAIREFVARGANVNAVSEDGATPLHEAARTGSLGGLVELLAVQGVEVDAQRDDGFTPLHLAADAGRVEAVLELLRKGADVHRLTTVGETAVHLAAKNGLTRAIGALAARGASLRLRNRSGETPLHKAAGGGHIDTVMALLSAGVAVNGRARRGATPLHYAAGSGSVASIRALRGRGADERLLTDRDETALHWAAFAGQAAAIREFVKPGAASRIDARNRSGETALHLAALSGSVDGVAILLSRRANVNQRTSGGETPLHMAAAGGHADVIRELLGRGADVNRRAKDGVTPLHMAAAGGGAEAVRELLARGGGHDDRARNGVTPLHMAAVGGHLDAIRELAGRDRSLLRVAAHKTKPSAENTLWWLSLSTRAWLRANGSRARKVQVMSGVTPIQWAEELGHKEAADAMRAFR